MAKKSLNYGLKTYNISYEILNPKEDKAILFLHGWGANKEIMKKAFENEFAGYKHIYLDMPGFGNSDIFSPLYTCDYAKIIKKFLENLAENPTIIVGHSFGGKVATLLEPENLILLSSAGIVAKKRFSVRLKIAIFKFLKLFGFGRFYRLFATKDISGMSRTMYETLKNVVDEDFTLKFKNLKSKTIIFWGENDKATPLKSGEFINRLIKNSSFYKLSGDHFFFLLHAKFISIQSLFDIQNTNSTRDLDDE